MVLMGTAAVNRNSNSKGKWSLGIILCAKKYIEWKKKSNSLGIEKWNCGNSSIFISFVIFHTSKKKKRPVHCWSIRLLEPIVFNRTWLWKDIQKGHLSFYYPVNCVFAKRLLYDIYLIHWSISNNKKNNNDALNT